MKLAKKHLATSLHNPQFGLSTYRSVAYRGFGLLSQRSESAATNTNPTMNIEKQYQSILIESYAEIKTHGDDSISRLEYLCDYVFEFTTYDGAISELFATKALEVASAISNKTTFDYIKDQRNYEWFTVMCNMDFFSSRIEWGTSIRGCWWDHGAFELECTGIYTDGAQCTHLEFSSRDDWSAFIHSMIEFSKTT